LKRYCGTISCETYQTKQCYVELFYESLIKR